ncbi:MAG: helix-turn-helix domain-containing protein [Phycisphaerales bacterium]|nr:helix-turn-helix transcriptional regulator [Planctomycetota bacterium]
MPRPTFHPLSRTETRALTSATRQEIVDAITSAGPCTVARLAQLLGRRPDGLYFHVRALERVGLVRSDSESGQGRRAAAVYRLPGPAVKLDYQSTPRKDLCRVVRHALKLSLREFERECLSGRDPGRGASRHLWGGRLMGWVDASQLARVNTLLEELHAVLRAGRPGPGRKAVSLGFLLAPSGLGERVRGTSKSIRTKERGHS